MRKEDVNKIREFSLISNNRYIIMENIKKSGVLGAGNLDTSNRIRENRLNSTCENGLKKLAGFLI